MNDDGGQDIRRRVRCCRFDLSTPERGDGDVCRFRKSQTSLRKVLKMVVGNPAKVLATATQAVTNSAFRWTKPRLPLVGGFPEGEQLPTIDALILMGILSTAHAYFPFFRLLPKVGAANTLQVGFLVPVCAALLGVTLVGERLNWPEACGLSRSSTDQRPDPALGEATSTRVDQCWRQRQRESPFGASETPILGSVWPIAGIGVLRASELEISRAKSFRLVQARGNENRH